MPSLRGSCASRRGVALPGTASASRHAIKLPAHGCVPKASLSERGGEREGNRPLLAADARGLAFAQESPEALPRNNHPKLPHGASESGSSPRRTAGNHPPLVGEKTRGLRPLRVGTRAGGNGGGRSRDGCRPTRRARRAAAARTDTGGGCTGSTDFAARHHPDNRRSRCGAHRAGCGSRDELPSDVELQAHRQCASPPSVGSGLRRSGVRLPDYLHSGLFDCSMSL